MPANRNEEDTTAPKKTGRPRKEIDLAQVERLATIHCTDEEIAAGVGVSVDTLARRKKEPAFADAYTRGRQGGKRSLRRKQFEVAMAGNVRMLEWLGKQYLEQRDKQTTEVTGDDEHPIATGFDNLLRRLVPELAGGGAREAPEEPEQDSA